MRTRIKNTENYRISRSEDNQLYLTAIGKGIYGLQPNTIGEALADMLEQSDSIDITLLDRTISKLSSIRDTAKLREAEKMVNKQLFGDWFKFLSSSIDSTIQDKLASIEGLPLTTDQKVAVIRKLRKEGEEKLDRIELKRQFLESNPEAERIADKLN